MNTSEEAGDSLSSEKADTEIEANAETETETGSETEKDTGGLPPESTPILFREGRDGRLVTIDQPDLVVDITCDGACSGGAQARDFSEKSFIKLAWGDMDSSIAVRRPLRLFVDEASNVTNAVFGGLRGDNYKNLRNFVCQMYSMFRARIVSYEVTTMMFELAVDSSELMENLETEGETVEALCRSLVETCCGEDVKEFAVVFEETEAKTFSQARGADTRPVREKVSAEKVLSLVRSARENKMDVGFTRISESVDAALVDESPVSPSVVSLSTVLCLDASASVEGEAFEQIKRIANMFVDGVDEIAVSHGVEENVAVVSMSERARILQQLTIDFTSVRAAIESLEPGGLSPIFETLVVSRVAILRKGGVYQMSSGHQVPPRIIFITDGRVTDENQEGGADTASSSARMQLIEVVTRLAEEDTHITWIPVGDAEVDFLRSLAKLGKGKVVEEKDVPKLVRYLRREKTAGKIFSHARTNTAMMNGLEDVIRAMVPDMSEDDQEEISETVAKLFKSQMIRRDHHQLGAGFAELFGLTPTRDEVPMAGLADMLNRMRERDQQSEDDFNNVHEVPGLPPLGTRVIRGPDWEYKNQDSGGVGTIVNHCKNSNNWVRVYWDNGGKNNYRYNAGGAFDLLIADDCPRDPESRFFVQIGVRVEKDPNYTKEAEYKEGMTGVVIRIGDDGSVAKVRWDDGRIVDHKFEPNGIKELQICDPIELLTRMSLREEKADSGQSKSDRKDSKKTASYKSALSALSDPANVDVPERAAVIHETLRSSEGTVEWRWREESGQWTPYPEEDQTRLTQTYRKRPHGTVLVTKGDDNYRVAFKTMSEKCVSTEERHEVDAIIVEDEETEEDQENVINVTKTDDENEP